MMVTEQDRLAQLNDKELQRCDREKAQSMLITALISP
jgi:hypothetical protein